MHRLLRFDYLYLIPLLLSAVSSLRSFRRKWPKPFRAFSVLLLITLIVEIFALAWKWWLYKKWGFNQNNHWIYGALISIRHLFILYFFYEITSFASVKRFIRISVIPVFLFGVVNYVFIQTPYLPNNYTLVITSIVTILLCLCFFYQVLRAEKIIVLNTSAEVWIALGTFLYYGGTLPFFTFFTYLLRTGHPLFNSYLYINDAMNIVMYSSYLIAFLCKPQFQK